MGILCGNSFILTLAHAKDEPESSKLSGSPVSTPYQGVNVLGYYTTIPESKGNHKQIPDNYFDHSFRIISDAGLGIIRYLVTWESYEKHPTLFMDEIIKISQYADKYNLHVIYTNNQFHISSWLDPLSGYGFPSKFFRGNKDLPYNGGGASDNATARLWWTKWYDRSVIDESGKDGWMLQAEFFKNIVNTVDNHTSTLGYEILNEPQVYSVDQWKKIGNYNSFISDQLRKVTDKTIVFDRQLPSDVGGPIHALPANMAQMIPRNTTNLVFKATLFGLPAHCSYAEARLNTAARTAQLLGIPLWLGEFNIGITPKDRIADINQSEINQFIKKFREVDSWGWSFWIWSFREPALNEKNYGLVNVTEQEIMPTKYFNYFKHAVAEYERDGTAGHNGENKTHLIVNYKQSDGGLDHDKWVSSNEDTICPTAPVTKISGTRAGTDYLQSTPDSPIIIYTDSRAPSILIEGEAYDSGSGVQAVDIRLKDTYYRSVFPDINGNWSKWSFVIPVTNSKSTETELIIRATDNAGNVKHHTIFVHVVRK